MSPGPLDLLQALHRGFISCARADGHHPEPCHPDLAAAFLRGRAAGQEALLRAIWAEAERAQRELGGGGEAPAGVQTIERTIAAADIHSLCPAICPPHLARAGERCELFHGHDGWHVITMTRSGKDGSSWTEETPCAAR